MPEPIDFRRVKRPLIPIPVTAEDVARKRRRVRLMWLAVLVALTAGSGWIYKRARDPREAQQSLDAGNRLFTDARYSQAILSFDRAILLMPGNEDAYLMRGRAQVAQYENEPAVLDFTRAIELRPRDTRPLLERGRVYFLDKKYSPAIADASAALAVDPNLGPAYNLRGMALRAAGNPAAALEDFQHAVAFSPDAENYYQRGATYESLGEHRLAIADFTPTLLRATSRAPNPNARWATKRLPRSTIRRAAGWMAGSVRLRQRRRLCARIIQGVEQQLEGSLGLAAEGYIGRHQDDFSGAE